MKDLTVRAALFTLILVGHSGHTTEFLRACYFTSWSIYRPTAGKYDISNIDPNLCTHLIYAFGKLDSTTKQLVADEPSMEEGDTGKFRLFNSLKEKNPSLKTLISVGGQNVDSATFLALAQTDDILQGFSKSAVQFLRTRGFDGIDIDWEFPDSNARSVFTRILKALRTAFDEDTKSPKLLLTFAGPPGQWNIDPGYDVPEIVKYIDYANLMTYDYTEAKAKLTAFNSPLFSRSNPLFNPTLSTNWTVHYWHSLGLPYNMMLVGVTGVGRRLVLEDPQNWSPGSNTTREVRTGAVYQIEAGLAYPEICQFLKNESTKRIFDEEQKCPYAVNGDDWVGYEDKTSLEVKLQWMQNLSVAGLMFWSLDYDDFTGQFCNEGKYPLLNLVLSKTAPPSSATTTTTTTSTAITTLPPSQTTKGNGSGAFMSYNLLVASLATCTSALLIRQSLFANL